jgi:spore maturation protein CgeB
VGFIGSWEKERVKVLEKIAETGTRIHIWGGGWDKSFLSHPNVVISPGNIRGDEYARALRSLDIALCLLAKRLGTLEYQTTRSIEIPACGVFMLADRTDEHMALFEEGKEAEFFSTPDELIEKIRYYLDNPVQRKQIAAAGRERCLRNGYSNQERIRRIFKDLLRV